MQIILLILAYLISSFINNPPVSKSRNKKKLKPINWLGFDLGRIVPAFITGIAGALVLDLVSMGEPVWPALALPALVIGGFNPPWKAATKENTGIFSYIGAIFYLNPVLALVSLGLTLEVLIVGKDKLLAILIFSGLIPVLIRYAQINPYFLWAAIGVQIIILWEFKKELLNKIKLKNVPE